MDVRTICLGLLTRGDATGYEMKKLFEEEGFGHFAEASFGSIYPALGRLTDDERAAVRQEVEERVADFADGEGITLPSVSIVASAS